MLKAVTEKGQVKYKGNPIRSTVNLSAESLQIKRNWGPIFSNLKEKKFGKKKPRISNPTKLSFLSEGEIKSFSNKKILRESITIKYVYKRS